MTKLRRLHPDTVYPGVVEDGNLEYEVEGSVGPMRHIKSDELMSISGELWQSKNEAQLQARCQSARSAYFERCCLIRPGLTTYTAKVGQQADRHSQAPTAPTQITWTRGLELLQNRR
jgi:hypothetical protein